MSMLGDLSEFSLPNLFQLFERSGRSGQLSIWTPLGVHRIVFYQGRIVAAIAPEPQYSLRAMVCDLGILSEARLQQLEALSDCAEPLGKLLKKQQLVDASQLALTFRKQIQVAIYPLFLLEKGQFRFSAKTPIPYPEMTGMSKSSIEVAMNALRQCESDLPGLESLPQPESCFIKTQADLPLLKFSALEWGVLENAAPDQTVQGLSQALSADLQEVRRVCHRLSQVSLLEELKSPLLSLKDSEPAELVAPVAEALKSRLQARPEPARSLEAVPAGSTVARPSAAGSDAVNSTLLSRFAAMLRKF